MTSPGEVSTRRDDDSSSCIHGSPSLLLPHLYYLSPLPENPGDDFSDDLHPTSWGEWLESQVEGPVTLHTHSFQGQKPS